MYHLATRRLAGSCAVAFRRSGWRASSSVTDSITYSGGQAKQGQGGYYGSGGARVIPTSAPSLTTEESRQTVLALAADVARVTDTMKELEVLESLLRSDDSSSVTSKSMELKNQIKKLMTSKELTESLHRLEIEGEPVWGLSSKERELIMMAREKANEC